MARATAKETQKPGVTLELTGREADVLAQFITCERWPKNEKCAFVLNDILYAMDDVKTVRAGDVADEYSSE